MNKDVKMSLLLLQTPAPDGSSVTKEDWCQICSYVLTIVLFILLDFIVVDFITIYYGSADRSTWKKNLCVIKYQHAGFSQQNMMWQSGHNIMAHVLSLTWVKMLEIKCLWTFWISVRNSWLKETKKRNKQKFHEIKVNKLFK